MQIPRAVAAFNKLVTNRVQGLWAWVLPPWAILRHTGRKSGTVFRTPVVGFCGADGFAVPLLYGEQSDWLRNLLAAGGGIIERKGRKYELTAPRVVDSASVAINGIGARYVRAAPKAFVATIGPRVQELLPGLVATTHTLGRGRGPGGGGRADHRRVVIEVSRPSIEPGSVWFCDFDPVRGREQGKDRPALVVSSAFHLRLTAGALVSVLPLTSVERPGWLHRIPVAAGNGWVITEQVRTIAMQRFRRPAPEIALSTGELAEVQRVLAKMLLISA